jgi:hypothetical protein
MSDHRYKEIQDALEAYQTEMSEIQARLAELRREEHDAWIQLRNVIFANIPDKLSPYFDKQFIYEKVYGQAD